MMMIVDMNNVSKEFGTIAQELDALDVYKRQGIGGKDNVVSLDNCITRLRFEIKDYTKVDEKKIKSAGVAGVIRPNKNNVCLLYTS